MKGRWRDPDTQGRERNHVHDGNHDRDHEHDRDGAHDRNHDQGWNDDRDYVRDEHFDHRHDHRDLRQEDGDLRLASGNGAWGSNAWQKRDGTAAPHAYPMETMNASASPPEGNMAKASRPSPAAKTLEAMRNIH
jgi:hypothetical protein